jgi:hypothetical protein
MEHRWGDRQPVILGLRLHGPDRTCAIGWLTDVSLSGAYVKTESRFAVMSKVTLELDADSPVNAAVPRPLRLQGRVVRHGATGMGVEWEEFASGTPGEILRSAMSIQLPGQTREAAQDPGLWTPPTCGMSRRALDAIEP